VDMKVPCEIICDLYLIKGMIFEKQGRKEEALEMRDKVVADPQKDRDDVYYHYHKRLMELASQADPLP